jgi:predicted enzyme related to lactoylglutathione lyase
MTDTQSRFFWYELMTSDQDAAIDFYTQVVGWSSDQIVSTPDGGRYRILSAGDRAMGGVLQIGEDMRSGGAKPAWVGYVHVADTDAAARKIAEAGGRICMEPTDIPGIGRFAMAIDPGGAPFYVMTPLPRSDEPPPAGEPTALGLMSWRELYAGNGEKAAFAFYSGQFGWETLHEMPMGPMGTYRIFGVGEEQMGGMMDKQPQTPESMWNFYVNVDSVDAAAERIKANGGEVVMGPMEVPGGSWVIQGVDPQGARFALISAQR